MSAWLDRLPHGPAFRYLTAIENVEPGVSGVGVMSVHGDEPWIAAHFPGRPVVPGVLIVEALAQLSGLVAWSDQEEFSSGALAQVDVRFPRPVIPPADIRLTVQVERRLGNLARCSARAGVHDETVCSGILVLTGETA